MIYENYYAHYVVHELYSDFLLVASSVILSY
jgi:hypothetical protein